MRPVKQNLTATGAGVWVPVNWRQRDFKVSLAVILNGATTATYTVEHTFDDILNGATPRAFQNAAMTSLAASADGNYVEPVTAVRLNVAAIGGDNSIDFLVLQGDDAN